MYSIAISPFEKQKMIRSISRQADQTHQSGSVENTGVNIPLLPFQLASSTYSEFRTIERGSRWEATVHGVGVIQGMVTFS